MGSNERIRLAVERVADVFRKKPAAALNTKRASGRVDQGLVCHARQDGYTATMDMPEPIGGDGSAPSPGFHIRVGLVGCIAIGIKLTAAREGLDIGAIDVDVEMDFDDAAMIGVSDNTAAPLETRITIRIESAAPWEEVEAMVARALERDPYFIAFRDAQPLKTKLVAAAVA
ncbi:MAG TPA: OsmC family protein [Rhizobiaceae bacterium]